MAARVNAGEMRTKITIKNPKYTIQDGFGIKEFVNAFTRPLWCKWVNAHGAEIYQAAELRLREPATITMRYSPLVTVESRIWRERDTDPYEVISINNVNDRCEFFFFFLQRVVTA